MRRDSYTSIYLPDCQSMFAINDKRSLHMSKQAKRIASVNQVFEKKNKIQSNDSGEKIKH